MKDFIGFIFLAAGFCFAITVFIILPLLLAASFLVSRPMCDSQWGDFDHRWELIGGCLVKTDVGYVPEKNVRVTQDGTIVSIP